MSRADEPTEFDVVAVVGPTAAGKSALALEVAVRLGGEIVNADALQMYRGLDIGTATPTPAERSLVPHHLFAEWQVDTPASVADFQARARAVVRQILERGAVPVVVGGSVLYLRALCDQLEIPPTDPQVRHRLEDEAQRLGTEVLAARLRELDPAAAAAIDPRNTRRVVRALEVVELTGSFTARLPAPVAWRPTVWLGVDRSREELDARIAERAERMWSHGLLAETRGLLPGLADAPTAAKAVGYEQALAVLAGRMTPEQGLAETIRLTRRLARRQQRAFRRDDRIHWLSGDLDSQVQQARTVLGSA